MRVAYLFTTFPKLSERFFLREVQELRKQGMELEVYSMIGGIDHEEGGRVTHFRGVEWILMFAELLIWVVRRPLLSLKLIGMLNPFDYRSVINYGENALGLAFAFRYARDFEDRCLPAHGTWATAPGMAAYAINALTSVPYTLEAHAYDIFRMGGDAHFGTKVLDARRIRSSTDSAAGEIRRRLELLKGDPSKVICVRRGLDVVPGFRQFAFTPTRPFRILSVGRLIEKKGYSDQLRLFDCLRRLGFAFQAEIVGGGPLEDALKKEVEDLGLSNFVEILGKLSHDAVDQAYLRSDAFIFYGRVSNSGDRDGFPNVIGEAMSHSVPVFSTDVAGTTEVIEDEVTGFLLSGSEFDRDAQRIIQSVCKTRLIGSVAFNAYRWVQHSFSVQANAAKLRHELWGRIKSDST